MAMDTIIVEGTTYTKASILAKEFRYTTDYIGQLCRANKVACQLVGRAWYVSRESLLRHKDARYKETRLSEKILNYSPVLSVEGDKISVGPRLKRVTAKQNFGTEVKIKTDKVAVLSRYFPDDGDLLPQPLRRIVPTLPKKIEVDVPDAKKLKVDGDRKPQKLDFTELPAVPLEGVVKVREVEIEGESFDLVTESDIKKLVGVRVQNEVEKVDEEDAVESPKIPQNTKAMAVKTSGSRPLVFTPSAVVYTEKTTHTAFLIPLSLVTASVLFVFMNASFQKFEIEGTEVTAAIIFSLENIKNLF